MGYGSRNLTPAGESEMQKLHTVNQSDAERVQKLNTTHSILKHMRSTLNGCVHYVLDKPTEIKMLHIKCSYLITTVFKI